MSTRPITQTPCPLSDEGDDLICGGCGAYYLPDEYALLCSVCDAEGELSEEVLEDAF